MWAMCIHYANTFDVIKEFCMQSCLAELHHTNCCCCSPFFQNSKLISKEITHPPLASLANQSTLHPQAPSLPSYTNNHNFISYRKTLHLFPHSENTINTTALHQWQHSVAHPSSAVSHQSNNLNMGQALSGLNPASNRGGRVAAMATYKVNLLTPEVAKVFECPDDVYILDAAEKIGKDLPYSCRARSCSSCAGNLIRVNNSSLDDEQMDAGWVLTCVTYPTGNVVLETHQKEALTAYVMISCIS